MADINLDELVAQVRLRHPDAEPLEHVTDAVLAAQHINQLADELIGHFVDEARRSGASWAEIGQSLGVTKQAAQKRFVPKGAGLARFTEPAQRAIVVAQDEARRTGSTQVGGEHILLGAIGEPENLAARAIASQGVSLDSARDRLADAAGPAAASVPDHIPYSPEAKKIRELAAREALRLGHSRIGTDDILLAVLRDGRGRAARTLATLGVHCDRTERCLRALASGDASRE
jgi:hypothetical protein